MSVSTHHISPLGPMPADCKSNLSKDKKTPMSKNEYYKANSYIVCEI